MLYLVNVLQCTSTFTIPHIKLLVLFWKLSLSFSYRLICCSSSCSSGSNTGCSRGSYLSS